MDPKQKCDSIRIEALKVLSLSSFVLLQDGGQHKFGAPSHEHFRYYLQLIEPDKEECFNDLLKCFLTNTCETVLLEMWMESCR